MFALLQFNLQKFALTFFTFILINISMLFQKLKAHTCASFMI